MAGQRAYRGTFSKVDGRCLLLDFYAENRALALSHAAQVASDTDAHREFGTLTVVKVRALGVDDVYDTGSFGWAEGVIPRLSPDRISLARRFLSQFAELKRKDTTEVGWLMLKFSCSRREAQELVEAIEQEPDISDVDQAVLRNLLEDVDKEPKK